MDLRMLLGIILGLALGSGFCLLFVFLVFRSRRLKAEAKVRALLESAEKQAQARTREAELAAKDYLYQARAEFEKETKAIRAEQAQLQERLRHREETLDKKVELIDQKELELNRRDRKILAQEERVQQLEKEVREKSQEMSKKLEMVAGLSAAEAKKMLMDSLIEEAKHEAAIRIKQVEDEAKAEAEKNAKRILSQAIDRYAGEYVAECTVSVIPLPNDEMKGRIIGREGRNIRALESATGVDLIIDDTPDAVTLSGFDPVRREIARLALTKLVTDGRIHPARIEEVVHKTKLEVEAAIREWGEEAALEAGVHGLHPEVIKLLGRMNYRTSYGQNIRLHSVEVAHLAAVLAAEIGADVNVAKRAGLLHDLGKAVDHEFEGPHALIGAELAKRYGESPRVVHAIAAHHADESEPQTLEAIIVQAADAISGARPGARRETLEHYIKRLEALENVANSFEGVEKSFAIQAGREVRIIVKPEEVDDLGAVRLARDVVKRIEETLQYPGQVKVTVVRETRAVDYAK